MNVSDSVIWGNESASVMLTCQIQTQESEIGKAKESRHKQVT